MYTIDDVYVYIFSWKKVTENVKPLYKNVVERFPNTTIINCDENENFLAREIHLDDNYYYGGQFETAIRDVPKGKIFGVIVGDVFPNADWEKIAKHCVAAFNTEQVGIYAPDVNTIHSKRLNNLWDDLWSVDNTDCTCWFMDPAIVSRLASIPYYRMANLGWIIDMMFIEESKKMNKYVVRDYAVRVEQPPGSGYSYKEALNKSIVLRQLYGSITKNVVFSFSLWGTNPKYTEGMIQNARQIEQQFPTARVWVYMAEDVPTGIKARLTECSNVAIVPIKRQEGALSMFDRFTAIDDSDCDIMFVRDADSRVHDRDAACVYDFLASDKALHVIRDHYHHKSRIMGGMWGFRKQKDMPSLKSLIEKWRATNPYRIDYYCDQHFLNEVVYPMHNKNMMVHDRNNTVEGEDKTPFAVPIVDDLFVGQVFMYNDGKELTEFKA